MRGILIYPLLDAGHITSAHKDMAARAMCALLVSDRGGSAQAIAEAS